MWQDCWAQCHKELGVHRASAGRTARKQLSGFGLAQSPRFGRRMSRNSGSAWPAQASEARCDCRRAELAAPATASSDGDKCSRPRRSSTPEDTAAAKRETRPLAALLCEAVRTHGQGSSGMCQGRYDGGVRGRRATGSATGDAPIGDVGDVVRASEASQLGAVTLCRAARSRSRRCWWVSCRKHDGTLHLCRAGRRSNRAAKTANGGRTPMTWTRLHATEAGEGGPR